MLLRRRRNWVKTMGRVLDSRIRTVYDAGKGSSTQSGTIPLHSYVVEFRAPHGELTRLEVEQGLRAVDFQIGDEVPLLVKPDGTKAILDEKDPRVSVVAVMEASKRAEEERFRRQLEG